MKTAALLLIAALAANAAPRRSLADYPLHASNADFDIGVEYTVHSYGETSEGAAGQMYLARDFLVFEIAIFPKHAIQIPEGAFELTVNKSRPLPQVQPEVVAMTLRNADWTIHSQLEAAAGIGDAGVTIGRPQRTERFPGDQTTSRLPAPPRAPDDPNAPRKIAVDPAKLAVESAFVTGAVVTPRSGNIYFPYSGNPARIKQLILHLSTGQQSLEIHVK